MIAFLVTLIFTYSNAANDGSNEASILRSIQYLNKLSTSSKMMCGGAEQVADEITSERLWRSQLCSTLETYAKVPATQKLNFDNTDPKNVCSGYWKDGKSPFLGQKVESLVYAKGRIAKVGVEYKAPSRKEVISMGFSIGTEEQLQSLEKEARNAIEEVSSVCCMDNVMCKTAMSKVNVKICKDANADQDPSREDGCYGTRTSYYKKADGEKEFYPYLAAMASVVKNQFEANFIQAYGLSPDQMQETLRRRGWQKAVEPSTGFIGLSPYFVNGAPYSRYNLIHELSHACSSIRRQTLIFQSDKDAAILADSFSSNDLPIDKDCSVTESQKVAYQKVLMPLDGTGGLATCLVDMSIASKNESSSVYSPEACPSKKMEESAAEGMALAIYMQKGDLIPQIFPSRICEAYPSNVHAHSSELAKCLLLKSPKILKSAQAGLDCGKNNETP